MKNYKKEIAIALVLGAGKLYTEHKERRAQEMAAEAIVRIADAIAPPIYGLSILGR